MAGEPSRNKKTWIATVLTLFPDMLPGPLGQSLAGKAQKNGIWNLETVDIRNFARDKQGSVDAAPFGGGPGMVMRPDILADALDYVRSSKKRYKTHNGEKTHEFHATSVKQS